jgi:hypothetical protein
MCFEKKSEKLCKNSSVWRPALVKFFPLNVLHFLTGWLDIFCTLTVDNHPEEKNAFILWLVSATPCAFYA